MDPIWTEIDHTLVTHKLSLISQEMQPKSVRETQRAAAVARKSGNSGSIGPSLVDAHVAVTDEWIDRVYQAYCEVWALQGNSKSARFIRVVFERALIPLIEVRQGAILDQLKRKLSRKPGTFPPVGDALVRGLKQLQGKWRDKIEIEAGSCKHQEQRREPEIEAPRENTLPESQGLGTNTAGDSTAKAPLGNTGMMSSVPSDQQAYRSVWHQVDHELVKLKTQEPLTKHTEDINEERNLIEHNTRGKRQAFLKDTLQMAERRAEEWIGIRYDIYCEVWKLQGREKSADFLRTLRDNIVEPTVHARMKAEIHHLTSSWKNNGYPAIEVLRAQLATFEQAMQLLEHRWKTRLEIEAREWEYGTAVGLAREETAPEHALRQNTVLDRKSPQSNAALSDFDALAGQSFQEHLHRRAKRGRVSPEDLLKIAIILDDAKFVPPLEHLERNARTQLADYNSKNAQRKPGPILTWRQLVESGNRFLLRGMRRRLSRAAENVRAHLSGI